MAASQFWLQLGADEVIPHGEGKGQLLLGPYQTFCNGSVFCNEPAAPSATLEMSGHEETVNALQGGVRAYLSSTNGPSRLILASDADSAFAGTVNADVTVVKRGAGTLRLNGAYVQGNVDLEAGTLVVGPGNIYAGATVNLLGGDVSVVPSGGCYEWWGNSGSSTETFSTWHAYPRYGERVEEVLKENPYRLVDDVEGIGFLTADRIAVALGLSPESPYRSEAALSEAGYELAQEEQLN